MKKFLVVLLLIGVCVLPALASAKTMTVEADATILISPDVEVVTGALPPAINVSSTGREGELRVSLGISDNPISTRYAVKETASGKYVDPAFGSLRDAPVWGLYSDWGSDQGVIVMVGALSSPAFIGLSKNSIDEVSLATTTSSLSGSYRASREPAEVITEAVVYGLGILVFAGLAVYQFRRMRSGKLSKLAIRKHKK